MRLDHNDAVVIDIGHTGVKVVVSWAGNHLSTQFLHNEGQVIDERGTGLNIGPVPAPPPKPKSEYELNAEKLAKLLDYCGHGGYEEQATFSGDRVNVTCSHCGSYDHQELICLSLDPLRVVIDPDRTTEEQTFENVDALRFYLEEAMAGC